MAQRISDLKVGQEIIFSKPKKYEFVKALAPGGTGKTILMRDVTIDKLFVCKKYDPQQKEFEKKFYQRFVDEIKILHSLSHDNIVRVYDYFLYPEYKTGFIVMEYVQGMNIDEYFQFNDPEKINQVFLQIINAFVYLEKNGVLHRDLRAENIMINELDVVKVIDFGFGKQIEGKPKEQASVLLNWPVSRDAQEIEDNIYNEQTEIYYVGCLVKYVIQKYDIDCFKYLPLLEKMTQINPENRINSFEEIQNSITEQKFEQYFFTEEQKAIYRRFASGFCDLFHSMKNNLILERDKTIVIEKLRVILRNNALEEYVNDIIGLISIFVKSGYRYYTRKIPVEAVKNFYEFLSQQSSTTQDIILNNLYGRLGSIKIDSSEDEELPFD